jgi:hypothetical protein
MKHPLVGYALLFTLLSAPAARAGDPLFPADVLGTLDFDAALDLRFVNERFDLFGSDLDVKLVNEEVRLRLGTGAGTQLGASLPYNSSASCSPFPCEASEAGNVEVFGRWRAVGGPQDAFWLAAEFRWITLSRHADRDGYAGGLTAGWVADRGFRPYVGYQMTIPDDTNTNLHALALGAHVGSGAVTFAPELQYGYYQEPKGNTPEHEFGVGLGLHARVARNTFISPDGGYTRFAGNPPTGGIEHLWHVGLTIYHRFGGAEPARVMSPPVAARAVPPPGPQLPPDVPAAVSPAPVAAPAFAAGQDRRLRAATALYPRPTPDSEHSTLPAGTALRLRADMKNVAGRWWYVEAGSQRGWVREGDL